MTNKQDYPFPDVFTSFLYIRTLPKYIYTLRDALNISLGDGVEGMFGVSCQALNCFGQYDVLAGIACPDLSRTSRIIYSTVDLINTKLPVLDFAFTFAYEITSHNVKSQTLGYINIKFKYPYTRINTETISLGIINELKQTTQRKGIEVGFRFFGSLGWHEMFIIVYGKQGEHLFELEEIINRQCKNIRTTNITCASDRLDEIEFGTDLDVDIHISNDGKLGTSLDNTPGLETYRSLNHSIINIPLHGNQKFVYKQLWADNDLKFTRSIIKRKLKIDSSDKAKIIDTISFTSNNIKDGVLRLESKPIAHRKLAAVLTDMAILRNNEEFKYIIPEKLFLFVSNLLDTGGLSDKTVQYYSSEIESILTERLAGGLHEVILGKDAGFFSKRNSYQRLLLACESLIETCYELYCSEVLVPDNKSIYVFFDYGSRLSTEIPYEILKEKNRIQIPLIIRLRQLKYKPWLWMTALKELAKLIYSHDKIEEYLQVALGGDKIESFKYTLLRHFLTQSNFSKLLLEHKQAYRKTSYNKYVVSTKTLNECDEIIESLPNIEYIVDKYFNESMFFEFCEMFKMGGLCFNLRNKQCFLNFVNAYYSLELSVKYSPKAFLSFVISLYWNHKNLKGVE